MVASTDFLGRIMHKFRIAGLALTFISSVSATAQVDKTHTIAAPELYEETLVTGGRDGIRTLPGSATFVAEDAIAKFDVSDINDLLKQVPGVYIRTEDGYGLRPNIGIRGATAERSQKITLMEDGILIAPAPYSAPAAYYVPNVSRMHAVEVFKGPASIHYGPHTVGGAVNMVTRPVAQAREGELSLTYGDDNYYKSRLFYGDSGDQLGAWIDILNYGADGFKELDGNGDTGFERNDVNAKIQWRSQEGAKNSQRLELKLGYADEDSNETYLGLTDADFNENPQRRYRASQLDKFTSDHSQVHLLHKVDFHSGWSLVSQAYVNRFDRAWNKFDGFFPQAGDDDEEGVRAATVLAEPDAPQMALIRGEVNSDGSPEQTLDVTNNARKYGSQGVAINASVPLVSGQWQHKLGAGLRFHHDYVERDHQAQGYLMIDGELQHDGVNDRANKDLNTASADAVAVYLSDEITIDDWRINLGVRGEFIDSELLDKLEPEDSAKNSQNIVIPGVGVFYQLTDTVGLLLGVNKGFSPNGASASDDVEPEESINYEYGVRYRKDDVSVDAIGFFSDYKNLIGRCRVSDVGCDAGDEFNGGNVEIAGLELSGDYMFMVNEQVSVLLNLVYTYTESAFQTSFPSGFSQWDEVQAGDELPYLPEQQLRFLVSVEVRDWALDFTINHAGQMREIPGQGTPNADQTIGALTTMDLAAKYLVNERVSLQLVAENLADKQEIVSRLPFGARPNPPRSIKVNASYRF